MTAEIHALDSELRYSVGIWSDDGRNLVATVAGTSDLSIGEAAFERALAVYPRRYITFRHGIRVIRTRLPDGTMRD
jgi:hypothetical protein